MSSEHFEEIDLDNLSILRNPSINKGTAFSYEERLSLGLLGLLPNIVSTIEDQIKRRMDNFDEQKDEFSKVLLLKDLRERNEVLYFKMLELYPEKLLPYVYTPMVGETAIKFSSYYTYSRGLFLSYPDKNHIDEILSAYPKKDVQVIVITDGSRILGLGDMGAGGMAIPIGKLDLYTVFGGINPAKVLPICLDVGTNNPKLLEDPCYIGWKHQRITGKDYENFLETVVNSIKKYFPNVLLQWEDFSKEWARPLLDRYQDKICSFNDDIQGTAASVLVGIMTSMKHNKADLKDQKIAILGGGSAGTGIAEFIVEYLKGQGIPEIQAKEKIFIVDVGGLITTSSSNLDRVQKFFAHDINNVSNFDLDHDGKISLLEVIKKAKITILIGVCGHPNTFTKEMIQEMAKNTTHPVIMPLSNPTSRSEATPQQIIEWSNGSAWIATGSPFAPVKYKDKTYTISQCNNVYIFPGLGLGIIATHAKKVTIEMFFKAIDVVSEEALKYSDGRLFPKISDLKKVSKKIAISVAKVVFDKQLHQNKSDQSIEKTINELQWEPKYKNYKKKKSV